MFKKPTSEQEKKEISQEDISSLIKTGLSSVMSKLHTAPNSLVLSKHYYNSLEELLKNNLSGFRPSRSLAGCTVLTVVANIDKNTGKISTANMVLSNAYLHQLNNSFSYYRLNLPNAMLEIAEKYALTSQAATLKTTLLLHELQEKLKEGIKAFEENSREMAKQYITEDESEYEKTCDKKYDELAFNAIFNRDEANHEDSFDKKYDRF